ncbi:MAG: ammonium transporter [Microcoleaceae cyanobacterium]
MADVNWLIICSALILQMQAGFMCLESCLTRSKNSINVAAKNITDFSVAALLYWGFGFALMFGTSEAGWIGSSNFFANPETPQLAAFFLFQTMFCGTAATIISGAVAERMKLNAYIGVILLISGVIYPLFGHWAWNGLETGELQGWLGKLGFVDFAGSTVVHSIGAWAALGALLHLGPRTGRFPKDQPAARIHGSNLQFSVLGLLLLWFGWFGFNGGSALALTERVPLVLINTVLAGATGLVSAAAWSIIKDKRPRVEVLINGCLGGLVAITACCHAVTPAIAVVIGVIAAVVVQGVAKLLEHRQIDDAVGAIAVQGGAGVWGTLAVGLFGQTKLLGTGLSRYVQIGVQVLGIVVAIELAFGVMFLGLFVLRLVVPLRVSDEEEKIGLNISEHEASTELYEFLKVIEEQAESQDLSLRAAIDPFTEVGLIAERYNSMLDALDKAVSQTNAIVETAINGIVTFTQQPTGLIIATANPSAAQIFGCSITDIIGLPLSRFIQWPVVWMADQKPVVPNLLEKKQWEMMGYRWDRSTFPLEASIAEIKLNQQQLYVLIFQDITTRHRARLALRQSRDQLQEKNYELEQALNQLKQTQVQLIQAEKMSSLGQVVAGVATEVSSPVSFIYGNIQPAINYVNDLLSLIQQYQTHYPKPAREIQDYAEEIDLEYLQADFYRLLKSMRTGAERIREIVKSLQEFSRPDEAEVKRSNIHESIESTLMLLQNRLKSLDGNSGVNVIREYGDLPRIECYPGQLIQVFINILNNSIEALGQLFPANSQSNYSTLNSVTTPPEQPEIRIKTRVLDLDLVEISISDNGPGIEEENVGKVFDSFFTTKPAGQGKGLGLSISREIIMDRHHGNLECQSVLGEGTQFIIRLPIHRPYR